MSEIEVTKYWHYIDTKNALEILKRTRKREKKEKTTMAHMVSLGDGLIRLDIVGETDRAKRTKIGSAICALLNGKIRNDFMSALEAELSVETKGLEPEAKEVVRLMSEMLRDSDEQCDTQMEG